MINIVVPVYNEESRFQPDYWEEILKIPLLKFLFVVDGSTDNSFSLFTHLTQNSVHQVVLLPKNVGKAEAVRFGLMSVLRQIGDDEIIGFMDADPAFDKNGLENFFGLASKLMLKDDLQTQQYNSLWASRVALRGRNIQRNPIRHYIGRGVNTCLGIFVPNMPYDTQCGLKLFQNHQVFKIIVSKSFKTKWFIDLELLIRWNKASPDNPMSIWEEPLTYWFDVPGSSLSFKSAIRVIKEMALVISESRSSKTI
jgi:dolichyl-phosphate beta-glucosyltransferase